MPVYDYACGACGRIVEVIHGIHADGPRFCPSCGVKGRMRKAVTAPAVVYKGSGWAKKDRRVSPTSGRSGSASETKPAAADGADSGTSSSDGSSAGKDSAAGAEGASPAGTSKSARSTDRSGPSSGPSGASSDSSSRSSSGRSSEGD